MAGASKSAPRRAHRVTVSDTTAVRRFPSFSNHSIEVWNDRRVVINFKQRDQICIVSKRKQSNLLLKCAQRNAVHASTRCVCVCSFLPFGLNDVSRSLLRSNKDSRNRRVKKGSETKHNLEAVLRRRKEWIGLARDSKPPSRPPRRD
jgi:hypothetical protein